MNTNETRMKDRTAYRCIHGLATSLRVLTFLLLTTSPLVAQYVETTRGCILCHESPQSRSDFISELPAQIWQQDDKHRRAFTLLHESDSPDPAVRASKQALVKQILGFDLREAFVDDRYSRLVEPIDEAARSRVATVKACIRCHGTWPKEADDRYVSEPPVPLEMGVSCQACHGPGERWLTAHFSEGWRRVTPDAKATLGCADCRSPVAKAKLCASCHVGNIAEDKFVRHEWYAAGHPPLPSFEMASFQAQMPRHWKSLREKGPFKFREIPSTGEEPLALDQRAALERAGVPADAIKGSYIEANFPGALAAGLNPGRDLAGFKDAVVGGAVAHSTYVQSIADYASRAVEGRASWPELALYDCTACHHELRSGLGTKTRPQRDHIPGRPPLATWPNVLTRLAERQVGGDGANSLSKLIEQQMQLRKATTIQPFGDARLMSAAASEAAQGLEQLALSASATSFDEQAARKALSFLSEPQNYDVADYSTARQAAWAIAAIANDLAPGQGDLLFSRNADDPLSLRLPSGPKQSVMENLRRWLPAAGKYDAERFRQEMERLRTEFSGPAIR
jgi:hypothetical protein